MFGRAFALFCHLQRVVPGRGLNTSELYLRVLRSPVTKDQYTVKIFNVFIRYVLKFVCVQPVHLCMSFVCACACIF